MKEGLSIRESTTEEGTPTNDFLMAADDLLVAAADGG